MALPAVANYCWQTRRVEREKPYSEMDSSGQRMIFWMRPGTRGASGPTQCYGNKTMGEKRVDGAYSNSKSLRGAHPRARAGTRTRTRAGARQSVSGRSSTTVRGGTTRANARTGSAKRRSEKSPAQIHEERMKNLKKAQRVRRKNLKEGRKMGANKPKRGQK